MSLSCTAHLALFQPAVLFVTGDLSTHTHTHTANIHNPETRLKTLQENQR